jgi:hypothetical protein
MAGCSVKCGDIAGDAKAGVGIERGVVRGKTAGGTVRK